MDKLHLNLYNFLTGVKINFIGKQWYLEWSERKRIEKEKQLVILNEKRAKALKLMEYFNEKR